MDNFGEMDDVEEQAEEIPLQGTFKNWGVR